MIKASNGVTILDGKNVCPINFGWQQEQLLAQHSESINCTSKLSNSETKVTEMNTYQQQDPMIFYGKIKC
jgi:hypothetical protein